MSTIYEKFISLHQRHYKAGNYLLDVPANISLGKKFERKYSDLAQAVILEKNQNISIFGEDISVIIHKPLKPIHRYEFEYYFGFNDHCSGYDSEKTIILCPKTFLFSHEKVKCLLQNIKEPMDRDSFCQLCLLMFLGGYTNELNVFEKLAESCEIEFTLDDMFRYLQDTIIEMPPHTHAISNLQDSLIESS
jgi:hypothetical protein